MNCFNNTIKYLPGVNTVLLAIGCSTSDGLCALEVALAQASCSSVAWAAILNYCACVKKRAMHARTYAVTRSEGQ